MSLTAENRANLEKLAAYLEALPADYSHFKMASFIRDAKEKAAVKYALHNGGVQNCGTAACAIGHGPAAGILVPADLVDGWCINWHRYSRAFVPKEEAISGSAWSWCFGGLWSHVDDSHYGAAARIRYLLAKGSPPPGFTYGDEGYLAAYTPYRIDAKVTAA